MILSRKNWIVFAFLMAMLAACKPKSGEERGIQKGQAILPTTASVLRLMPEDAVIAVAIPSVEKAEQKIHALLLRGAPKDMDMQAEIKVITSQAARGVNAFEATSFADIAAMKGIDPERPLALFFAAAREGERPEPPPGQAGIERELLRYIGIQSISPMAAVLPYSKRQDAEKFVVDWGGPETMQAKDLADLKTTLYANESGTFAYFFTADWLVAGTSPELVRGVADRLKAPAPVRYGTTECPADTPDEIVQLVRTDKIQAPRSGATPPVLMGQMPRGIGDAASQLWNSWIEPYKGEDPMIITWRFDKDQLVVRSRLDYTKHPDAKKNLAEPVTLAHLNELPKSTLGVWTLQITPQSRATLKDMVARSLGSQSGPLTQVGESLGKAIDATGNEATLAITGPGSDSSKIALLIEFQDGDAARGLLKELGLTPLKAETYNNVDIYSFVFPPVSVYYALPRSTFVLAGSLNTAKDLVDAVLSGKGGAFASGLNPPLDTQTPRQQALVGKRELFIGALLPALEGYGMVSKEQAQYSARAFEKVRDARMTTEVLNDWQDTRLVVQFD